MVNALDFVAEKAFRKFSGVEAMESAFTILEGKGSAKDFYRVISFGCDIGVDMLSDSQDLVDCSDPSVMGGSEDIEADGVSEDSSGKGPSKK